jgi:ParB/RepB/Spo0J family partition protein
MKEIELLNIDTRLEATRQRDKTVEQRLLGSIASQNICNPIYVAVDKDVYVLLDGFKRFRCARKLGYTCLPAIIIAHDVLAGIYQLIRQSETTSLNSIEEACLIDVLHNQYSLSASQIAHKLGRSNSWVSLRLGLRAEMSDTVREKILSGAFPLRAYMYCLRKFTRVKAKEVDAFVLALSSKGLGTRDIFLLAHTYFVIGAEVVRKQILTGNIDQTLRMLKTTIKDRGAREKFDGIESALIEELEECRMHIDCVVAKAEKAFTWKNPQFALRMNLLCAVLIGREKKFFKIVKRFYDQSGQTASSIDPASRGKE